MITTRGSFELLDFEAAVDRLRFDRHINLASIDLRDFRIAYCAGDLVHSGRIELYEWMWRDKIAGIVVEGDMTVEGNLEDNSFEGMGAFVLARGDLAAETITLGGAEVIVHGDVTTRGAVFNSYGGGRMEVAGSLRASHFVTDDHATVVEGSTPPRSFALGYVEATMREKLSRVDSYRAILTTRAANEIVETCGETKGPNVNIRVIEAIRAGRAILRD
jgi:hypothetical protein